MFVATYFIKGFRIPEAQYFISVAIGITVAIYFIGLMLGLILIARSIPQL